MKPPGRVNELQRRITRCASGRQVPVRRIERAVANTIVGQMLPPGVVKGGTAMKLRLGESASRFTPDMDVSRAAELTLEQYVEQLQDALDAGWGGFTGTLAELEPRAPDEVPQEYVMQPFAIRLSYAGKHWLTVPFELGRDEVGSTANRELRLSSDLSEIFGELALPAPAPIPVLAAEHQIVQKLHACTYVDPRTGGNDRAHDLVDLQILTAEEDIDWAAVGELGTRLFAARHAQAWPPTVTAHASWPTIYAEAADGLDVLTDIDAAVAWCNERIGQAVSASEG